MDAIWTLLKASFGFVLAVVAVRFVTFVSNLWQIRGRISKLRKDGKPVPIHSFFMGHLLQAKAAAEELPRGAHSAYVTNRLAVKLNNAEAFYFDPYPLADPLLVLTDYRLANQATNHEWTGSVKPPTLTRWFSPISGRGGLNLFTQNGQDWRRDHETFLPFFNNNNLDATLPAIIEEMLIFRDILRRKSQEKDIIRLEPLTLRLMNDVIGRVVFNAELGNQTSGSHPLSKAMLRQLDLKFIENDVVENIGQLNPLRSLEVWYNGRMLDTQIRAQVENRVAAFQSAKGQNDQISSSSMLDRVLADYFSQPGRQQLSSVDEGFMTMLCAQLRLLFFAGYDSTSSTMISMCYMIWKHPGVLAKLRAEHDEVFGRNVEACPDQIVENPSILNSLPYTSAVIKEVMRLFPAAAGVRQGCKDLVLKGSDGMEYPTEGTLVQINHVSIMRNPKTWPRPLEFLPERFLVGPEHELYPPKGAWRAFELGVRNCTGQAFVMKELRAFLAIFAREFEFEECYDEVHAGEKIDLTHVYNEKAFLIEAGSAHPRGKFPCRVSLSGYAQSPRS
ncbi:cytochrome P450 [Xylariaceae sp. FL1651]|nr:cytochrome P450 [Xylariaceae sp. FL1651]